VDTKDFLLKNLPSLFGTDASNRTVIDMGTGSGWALEMLRELHIQCKFIGLDFNEFFIEHLKSNFKEDLDADFLNVDLEEELPRRLHHSADVVFNFFNFFEIANLEEAFKNAQKMLKQDGKLVIMTIDSYYLMFALAKTMQELKDVLAVYEEKKSEGEVPYFFQKIDLGDAESEDYEYASVIYSLDDYYKQAKVNGMNLVDYAEVIKTSKLIPKVYQYIVFQK
jgi:ubiquinone/menaquinone biosynthesis C-methylase UbiE